MMDATKCYPVEGRTYRHYKGGLYRVVAVGLNEADKCPVVIYTAVGGKDTTWVRPVASWLETVVGPDGVGRAQRFELAD